MLLNCTVFHYTVLLVLPKFITEDPAGHDVRGRVPMNLPVPGTLLPPQSEHSDQTPHKQAWWTSYLARLPARDSKLNHLSICWQRPGLNWAGSPTSETPRQKTEQQTVSCCALLFCQPWVEKWSWRILRYINPQCSDLIWTPLEKLCVCFNGSHFKQRHKEPHEVPFKGYCWSCLSTLKTHDKDKTTIYAHTYSIIPTHTYPHIN